jgi:hypothetical protein
VEEVTTVVSLAFLSVSVLGFTRSHVPTYPTGWNPRIFTAPRLHPGLPRNPLSFPPSPYHRAGLLPLYVRTRYGRPSAISFFSPYTSATQVDNFLTAPKSSLLRSFSVTVTPALSHLLRSPLQCLSTRRTPPPPYIPWCCYLIILNDK